MFTGDMVSLLDTAGRARDKAAGVSGELELLATLISGEALVALGRAGEGDALITAAEPLLMAADPVSEIAEVIGMAAMCSMWIERFARAERVVDRLIAGGREAGAAGRLGYPLCVRAQIHWRRGRWSAAYADAEESVRLCRETQQLGTLAVALPTLARCEAALGHLDAARALGTEGLALADAARAARHGGALARLARLPRADGGARGGGARLVRPLGARSPGARTTASPALTMHAADRIEALARAGRRDDAQDGARAARRTGAGHGRRVGDRGGGALPRAAGRRRGHRAPRARRAGVARAGRPAVRARAYGARRRRAPAPRPPARRRARAARARAGHVRPARRRAVGRARAHRAARHRAAARPSRRSTRRWRS